LHLEVTLDGESGTLTAIEDGKIIELVNKNVGKAISSKAL